MAEPNMAAAREQARALRRELPPDAQGKVRDLYDLGDELLLVATDRISAFDYVLEDEIPLKGVVLTQLSRFWFELLEGVVENHLISTDVADLPERFQPWICSRVASPLCIAMR